MSYDFAKLLGSENLCHLQLTENNRFEIAQQVAEFLLCRGAFSNDVELLRLSENNYALHVSIRGNNKIPTDGNLVLWIAKELNKNVKDVVEYLLKGQGLDFQTLFGEISVSCNKGIPSPLSKPTDMNTSIMQANWYSPLPEHALRAKRVPLEVPNSLSVEGVSYLWQGNIPLSAKNGEYIGGIAIYRSNNHPPLILPLRALMCDIGNGIQRHRLRPGWNHQQLPLANEDCLLNSSAGTVLLSLDLAAAMCLISLYNEDKLSGNIIPTCHFGGMTALERVDWEVLRGYNVVIIPASTRESYADVYTYATKLLAQGARSVNICLYSLLAYPKPECGEDVNKISDPLVRHIVIHALEMAVASPEGLVQKVLNKTLPPEKFKAWGSENGLFKVEETEKGLRRSHTLRVVERVETHDATIYLDKIFVPELPSVWIGPSDGGKGMGALTAAVGLATQHDVFHFKVAEKKRCLYIDSETPKEEAHEKLIRISCGLGLKVNTEVDACAHWSLLSTPPDSPIDLANEDFKAAIESEICIAKADIVFFDNLLSLTDGAHAKSSLWNQIFEWFLSIGRKYGVATVCLHHTNKKGAPLGLVSIESKFRTVIMLDDLAKLTEEANGSKEPTPYVPFLKRPGCLMRLWCKKCKPYPQLKQKYYGYYLELREDNRAQGANWICVEQPQNGVHPLGYDASDFNGSGTPESMEEAEIDEEPALESVEEIETARSLIPEEHLPTLEAMPTSERDEVLKLLYEYACHHCQETFKIDQVKKLLFCSDSKAQVRVNSLVNFGLFDRLGKGRNTHYKIRAK